MLENSDKKVLFVVVLVGAWEIPRLPPALDGGIHHRLTLGLLAFVAIIFLFPPSSLSESVANEGLETGKEYESSILMRVLLGLLSV